jgi:N-acetylneuraminic acid mutarotase
VYVAGGKDNDGFATRTLFAYSRRTGAWTRRADLPIASACGASGLISGYLYVYQGCTGAGFGNGGALMRYSPATDAWATLSYSADGHGYPVAGVIKGKLYILGGYTALNVGGATAEVYDPATNTWTRMPPMPRPRVEASSAVLNGKLYVIGGATYVNEAWRYSDAIDVFDLASGSWHVLDPAPLARLGAATGAIRGQLYLAGGYNDLGFLDVVQSFRP